MFIKLDSKIINTDYIVGVEVQELEEDKKSVRVILHDSSCIVQNLDEKEFVKLWVMLKAVTITTEE